MINYIKDKKVVSKADLIEKTGWGRGIKFSPYRRSLMNHPNIFDKMGMLPYYIWKPLTTLVSRCPTTTSDDKTGPPQ